MFCYRVSVQLFCYRSYNNFTVQRRIPNFRYHASKGQPMANFSDTVKLPALENLLFHARIENLHWKWGTQL